MVQTNKNGHLELKFNAERTQVHATIHPPVGVGIAITAQDIMERLKNMGVSYGIREQAIRDGVHLAEETSNPTTVLVAQSVLPQDGIDAMVHYHINVEEASQPLPNNVFGKTDWLQVSPKRMMSSGALLASITPAQPGSPGKTLTLPINNILPRQGKPAAISAGDNVAYSTDKLHLRAEYEGCIVLHMEKISLIAMQRAASRIRGGNHSYVKGAVLLDGAEGANLEIGDFLAARGTLRGCRIRVHGDLYIENAEDCMVLADGDVYVTGTVKNCEIVCPGVLKAAKGSILLGGSLCATKGIHADVIGDESFTATELQTGQDRFNLIRKREIEEEMQECEKNRERIVIALRSLTKLSALNDERRAMVQKLQDQLRHTEDRIRDLHGCKRMLALDSREVESGVVTADHIHPGVWVRIGSAALQTENSILHTQFVRSAGGKSVQTTTVASAA